MSEGKIPTYKEFKVNEQEESEDWTIPTYKDFKNESKDENRQILLKEDNTDTINELIQEANRELTQEEQEKLDNLGKEIENGEKGFDDLMWELNEGALGKVLGGLGGAALGKSIGKMLAGVLGVEKGLLYDLLTSKVVAAAIGSKIGDKYL